MNLHCQKHIQTGGHWTVGNSEKMYQTCIAQHCLNLKNRSSQLQFFLQPVRSCDNSLKTLSLKGKVNNFRHTPDIGKFFLRNFAHKVTFIDENCQGHHPMPSRLEWCLFLLAHRHIVTPFMVLRARATLLLHADVKVISSRMRPLTERKIKTCYMSQYAVY